MITPSCDEILELAKEYTTIPVCREIYADMTTPISLLRRLQIRSDRFFLLESVEGGEKWARYSFLGYDPILRATCKNGTVTLEGTVNRTVTTDKPLTVLREVLGEYRAPRLEGPPFTGGFVGYFAYAMLGYAEPTLNIKRGAWDDFDLMLFDKVIAYDHLKQKIVLVVNMKTDSVMENYGKACAALEGMAATKVRFRRSRQPADRASPATSPRRSTPISWKRPANTSLTAIFFRPCSRGSFPVRIRTACSRRTACSAPPTPRRTWCSFPLMGTRSCVPLRKRSSDWITAA